MTEQKIRANFNQMVLTAWEAHGIKISEAIFPIFKEQVASMIAPMEEKINSIGKRLADGHHYLMGVDSKDITSSDALEALGYGKDGLNYL